MINSQITCHMMIMNEENWVWFAIKSVLPFVKKIIIYDTGSTDNTLRVIKSISSKKISLTKMDSVNRSKLSTVRNKMLAQTNTKWFMLVDGDEVWSKKSITKLSSELDNCSPEIWGVVVRTRNCIGDIYHYQDEKAGQYSFLGKKGHLTIRAYQRLKNFCWQGIYPNEAYCDSQGRRINEQDSHLKFLDVYYWHLTHLKRSNKSQDVLDREKKFKLELGIKAKKYQIPEIFFSSKRPNFVPSPFLTFSPKEKMIASILTPIRKVRRKVL